MNYIITHPSAMISPKKISDYKQHENPQGINGWLVEGRLYFDAFVLKNKRWAIYVSKANVYTTTFTVKDGESTPISGADIYINGHMLTSGEDGTATIDLPNGTHPYSVICNGYESATGSVTVSGKAASQDVTLTAEA